MIRVLVIFGTRPEAIKMAPVVLELQKHPDRIKPLVCVTGQHRQMLDQILKTFAITPHIDLDLMQENQNLSALSARAIEALDGVLLKVKPDIVLVQGDTTTAMAGALVAHYHKVPVGHIEAGLRTDKRYNPFPEEMNRRLISVLSNFHYAPTQRAVDILIKEGHPADTVFLTGNTVVDALLTVVNKGVTSNIRHFHPERRGILVTAHRRENFDLPLRNICLALREIVTSWPDVEIVYPVHLNPNIKGPVYELLTGHDRIHLIPPVDYEELVSLLYCVYLVLTDSGGIQEEAPALGKPVLVMRETTERPEGVEAGVARLVGTEPGNIVSQVRCLLDNPEEYRRMAHAVNPYGDGDAARLIVEAILQKMNIENGPD